MKIYLFGNEDYAPDALPFAIQKRLQKDIPCLVCVMVKPNEDLPFVGQACPIIVDTILGISTPQIFTEKELGNIQLSPRTSVHDFDLGFQLKYLTKIGKIHAFRIIGIPMGKAIDYDSIHSILRKLVEQDIQGS